ncbi:MAG: protein kinase [Actinomycetota bacterium]|jgi:serine/threonine-protein kinase|nr:protein kinase [Actinomycetota bacterium]
MAYCGNCGEVQREGDRFCGNCGAPTSIASPPRLGGYDLLGVLGRGATATVYLARDPTTGERLALKVLDPVVLGLPGARERLDQEVAVLASLRDPHLVGVRSIGEDAGRPFVAMDFVEGASLREIERRAGRLSPEQALGVLEGALRGLSRAHAKGIVHGDVKPENILVDREGTSKLVDFGHAFGTQGATAGGTPAYMSPEACRNLPQDRRSDLYSLGVVLYEALSGHVPFEAQSDAAVMRMHVSDPPPPIERLPGELGALLARALAKDPDDRPQSADAFLADLEAAAAGAYGRDWRRRAVVAGLVAGATAGVLTSASSAAAATAPSVPNSEGAKEPAQREPARHAGSTLSRSASPVRRALGFFSAHAVPTSVVAVIVVGAAVTAGVLSIHTRPSQSSIPRHQALATRIVASSTTTTTEPNSATTTVPSTSTTITPPVSTAPPTGSPATVISADATLSSDLHCSSLKIDSGVTLTSDGFNIYCSGAVTNDGTIVTGADNDSANFPASYGGSGGGGAPAGPCGPPQVGQPGHSTMAPGGQGGVSCNTPSTSENGSTPSRPTVTAATVAAWEAAGMRQYLAGAGGGDGYMRTCAGESGSPGAYGIAIEGSSVKVGTIDATGVAGVYSGCSGSGGGGGGGAVLIATDPGGYTAGTVNISGGAAGNQAGAGGSGQLIVVTTDLDTAPTTVTLLPAPGPARSWVWTAWCPFVPTGKGNSCTSSGDPNRGSVQLNGNLWNLGGGFGTSGSLTMSQDHFGGIDMHGDFPAVPPCTSSNATGLQPCVVPQGGTWVRGYPELTYGENVQCGNPPPNTSAPTSPTLPLPVQLSGMKGGDLVGTTDYTANPGQITYDISYDMWLNPAKSEHCTGAGTIEVMVWLNDSGTKAGPPGSALMKASIPYTLNGHRSTGDGAWSLYQSTGLSASTGGTVWVVLNKADSPRPTPRLHPKDPKVGGDVSVDLSAAFSEVGKLLSAKDHVNDFRSYWLDSIPFGVEFGPASGDSTYKPGDTSYFHFDVSRFCLSKDVHPSTAQTLPPVACGPIAAELYLCTVNYSFSTAGCYLRGWPNFPTVITTANETRFWRLTWRLKATSAIATGEFSFRECTPSCAAGYSETFPVTLVASQPKICTVKILSVASNKALTERETIYSSIKAKWGAKGAPPTRAYTPVTLFEGHIPACT